MSNSPLVVSENSGTAAKVLRSAFFRGEQSSFVTVFIGGMPRRLPTGFAAHGGGQQWQWQPAVQLRFVLPSIRFPGQAMPRTGDELKFVNPSVAPKI